MIPITPVIESNRALARQINDEARRDPQSPYYRKYVGIANGKVVAVSDNQDEMLRLLCQAEPDPFRRYVVVAGVNPTEAEEIRRLY